MYLPAIFTGSGFVPPLAARFVAAGTLLSNPVLRIYTSMEEAVSLKKCVAKALVYLILEVGALCGVPMRPDQIEQLMKIADRNVAHAVRSEDGDGKDRTSEKR